MSKFFSTNEGTADRAIRVIAGLAILSLTVLGPKTMWGLVGLIPLITGIAGTCPLYSIFGLNTCAVKPGATTPS